ncbi:MAG: pyruvate kinase [Patescibacteria group bacterium]
MNGRPLELMATLWPSFPHFRRFCQDNRLSGGIRLNSAMLAPTDIDRELALLRTARPEVPFFFDVKGRQMRVVDVDLDNKRCLDLTLNHAIEVRTPVPVLFKAGADSALLERVEDGGKRLVFQGGPRFMVQPGESLHIRDPSLRILGPIFTDQEKMKIEKFREAGCTRWFLSYVERTSDIEEFEELIGKHAEIRLKIESVPGLEFIEREFRKRDGLSLVAARGDLYVEVPLPHDILAATKLILAKDPEATVGSRILLSVVQEPVPSCADFSELAWLYDIGYRRMLLCDEMCLKESLLATAVSAFQAFREAYAH